MKWLRYTILRSTYYFGSCAERFKISLGNSYWLEEDASAIKRMSTTSAIPDATPVSVAAELLDDAKWKRGGKPEEKPAWSDVQQVGKPTAETRGAASPRSSGLRAPRVQRRRSTRSPPAEFESRQALRESLRSAVTRANRGTRDNHRVTISPLPVRIFNKVHVNDR